MHHLTMTTTYRMLFLHGIDLHHNCVFALSVLITLALLYISTTACNFVRCLPSFLGIPLDWLVSNRHEVGFRGLQTLTLIADICHIWDRSVSIQEKALVFLLSDLLSVPFVICNLLLGIGLMGLWYSNYRKSCVLTILKRVILRGLGPESSCSVYATTLRGVVVESDRIAFIVLLRLL